MMLKSSTGGCTHIALQGIFYETSNLLELHSKQDPVETGEPATATYKHALSLHIALVHCTDCRHCTSSCYNIYSGLGVYRSSFTSSECPYNVFALLNLQHNRCLLTNAALLSWHRGLPTAVDI